MKTRDFTHIARKLPYLVIAAATICELSYCAAEDLHWYSSINAGSEEAVPANRPILIEFWADWCGPCKVMDKEVYTDSLISHFSKWLVFVRIDYDNRPEVARQYHVESLPTLVFTDSYGGELFRHSGFLGAGPMIELLGSLPQNVGEFNQLNRTLSRNRNDSEALETMGGSLRIAKFLRASNEYYRRALQQATIRSNPGRRASILDAIASNLLELQEAREAASMLEKCLREFQHHQNRSRWMLRLGQAYAMQGNREKARKILGALQHEDPTQAPAVRRALDSLSHDDAYPIQRN